MFPSFDHPVAPVDSQALRTARRYFASSSVRYCTIEGSVVILDLSKGRYLTLNRSGSLIWNAIISGRSRDDYVNAIASGAGIDQAECEREIVSFVDTCLKRGLLSEYPEVAAPSVDLVRKSPGLIYAWLCLYFTLRSLQRHGFSRTYQSHLHWRAQPTASKTPRDLSAALKTFNYAENFLLMPQAPHDCLPRSLALHRFLATAGFTVAHCIGIKRFPFMAHAWVEANDIPLLDAKPFTEQFKVIART